MRVRKSSVFSVFRTDEVNMAQDERGIWKALGKLLCELSLCLFIGFHMANGFSSLVIV